MRIYTFLKYNNNPYEIYQQVIIYEQFQQIVHKI